jgi:Mce-associated membrane protein
VEVAVARSLGRLRRPSGPRAVALVVLLVLVAVSALLGLRLREASAEDARRQEILHAARQEAVNFTTVDHRHARRDLQRILDGATGQFAKDFRSGQSQVVTMVTQNEAVSKGEFLEAGIVSADEDSARVLVVLDADVSNTGQPKGAVRHYRLKMSLVREQGRWLTSKLEFVG